MFPSHDIFGFDLFEIHVGFQVVVRVVQVLDEVLVVLFEFYVFVDDGDVYGVLGVVDVVQ